jgi:hypothetical protein
LLQPTSVRQRALWLDSADDSQDIVVSEASAGFANTPCA